MTRKTTSMAEELLAEARAPKYVVGGKRAETFAHFASGLIVRAGRDRVRGYPGLKGAAPPTAVYYAVLARLGDASHVVDFGCGAGDGTRRLSARFARVTGIDSSPEAVTFAREWAPLASFVRADVNEALPCDTAELGIVADVLGHLEQPELALGRLRATLDPRASLVIAEPLAMPLQRLRAPARRALSPRSLEALLTRSGFVVSDWISTRGTFVACVARPSRGPGVDALLDGIARLRSGDAAGALEALATPQVGGSLGVAREARLLEARARWALGDGDGVARALMAAADIDPEEARALSGLGRLALLSGDPTTALRLALGAARLDPTEPDAAWLAAHATAELAHPDELSAWRVAASLLPDDVEVASALAAAAARRGDQALGIAVMEHTRSYDVAVDSSFHLQLCELYLAEGRRTDAELELGLARAQSPDDTAIIDLGRRLGLGRADAGS